MANYVAPVTGTWAAKGSSPFMAGRSGGRRYHAGNDLQAKNGSPAVASVGGTVIYAGHNQGYQWNAVVLGDDGNAFRYATHGPLSVKVGQRIEQGAQIGTIGRGHLHFEAVPGGSPTYNEMVANPGEFISTRYMPGGKASTIDPAVLFGVKRGETIAAGLPVGVAAPQAAQNTIASLMAPTGDPSVYDMPTAAMGYAPNLPGGMPPAPAPMPQVAAAGPPMPEMPPSWATNGGFPIDEGLSGASAQDVLMGGPRMDPRRADPATGPMPPDMGAMRSPADVLDAGPNLRPPIDVPMPMPPPRPTGPGIFQRNAMSGAPDAGMVPTPPARASGLPSPPPRPDINDPSLSFNAPPYAGGGPTGGPPMPAGLRSMGAGRPEFPGALPAAPRSGDLSAAMGNAPPTPAPNPYDDWTREFDTPGPVTMANEGMGVFEGYKPPALSAPPEYPVGNLNYDSMPAPQPYSPMVAGRPEFPGGGMPAAQGPFFENANPGPTLSLPPPAGTSFNIPPRPFEGSTGEGFTPAPPMPTPPPPNMMADRFNDAFSPGNGGQIMDLQTAFDQRNAPPVMNAQDGIDSIFGAPPVQAAPSNLAIPFAEVPGFDPGWVRNMAAGPPAPPGISMPDFDARFGGGSVVRPPTPVPGVTPGVVLGEMPQPGPVDIRPPIQGGPPMPAPAATMLPAPPPAPRQTSAGAGQRNGIVGRILGGLLGGPLGALGGGLLAGGGGFGFGSGGTPSWQGGGSMPGGGQWRSGVVQGKGNPGAPTGVNQWSQSDGSGTVTVYQDPWTGTYGQPNYGP